MNYGQAKNTFRWSVTPEEINYQPDKIICLADAIFLINSKCSHSLSEEDYKTVISLLLLDLLTTS